MTLLDLLSLKTMQPKITTLSYTQPKL